MSPFFLTQLFSLDTDHCTAGLIALKKYQLTIKHSIMTSFLSSINRLYINDKIELFSRWPYVFSPQHILHYRCQDSLAFSSRRGKTLTEEDEDNFIYFKVNIPFDAASSEQPSLSPQISCLGQAHRTFRETWPYRVLCLVQILKLIWPKIYSK